MRLGSVEDLGEACGQATPNCAYGTVGHFTLPLHEQRTWVANQHPPIRSEDVMNATPPPWRSVRGFGHRALRRDPTPWAGTRPPRPQCQRQDLQRNTIAADKKSNRGESACQHSCAKTTAFAAAPILKEQKSRAITCVLEETVAPKKSGAPPPGEATIAAGQMGVVRDFPNFATNRPPSPALGIGLRTPIARQWITMKAAVRQDIPGRRNPGVGDVPAP